MKLGAIVIAGVLAGCSSSLDFELDVSGVTNEVVVTADGELQVPDPDGDPNKVVIARHFENYDDALDDIEIVITHGDTELYRWRGPGACADIEGGEWEKETVYLWIRQVDGQLQAYGDGFDCARGDEHYRTIP